MGGMCVSKKCGGSGGGLVWIFTNTAGGCGGGKMCCVLALRWREHVEGTRVQAIKSHPVCLS
jgi:hypothetical protein